MLEVMPGSSAVRLDPTMGTERAPQDEEHVENTGLLDETKYLNYVEEMRDQPNWRREADKAADYYDGNQLTSAVLEAMRELGMAPIIENLMGSTIDTVLGMEEKSRTDWRVVPDHDRYTEVAEALSAKLHEIERNTRADRAISEAYKPQVIAGLGWVETSRESDPFSYPYRCIAVHRREIHWDWRSRKEDLTDARYLRRRRWMDLDVARLMFWQQRELIKFAGTGWAAWDDYTGTENTGLSRSHDLQRDWTVEESEWVDVMRERVCIDETWYRVWVRGHVFNLPDGRVIECDLKNPKHCEAVAHGYVRPQAAVYSKLRLSYWLGPHKLADVPNPNPFNRFQYVQFIGKREDLTGTPYGLGRAMIPMQDEVNARATKQLWLLSAKRVTMTKGVAGDIEEVRQEAARPDAIFELDHEKMRQGGVFKVESDFQLSDQQYKVLIDRRDGIKNVAGVFNALQGRETATTSGIALNTLVEQGTTTLAELNGNYRHSKQQVGENLLAFARADMGEAPQEVTVGEYEAKRKIFLNKPVQRSGYKALENDVQRSMVKVGLTDVPQTPAYRAQHFTMLAELVKGLPPQIQGFVIDFVMEASDLPNRRDIVERLRKVLNLPPPGQKDGELPTPEQLEQIINERVAQAVQQLGLDIKDREVKVKERDAETRARAADGRAKTDQEKVGLETARFALDAASSVDQQAQAGADDGGKGGSNASRRS